MFPLPLRRPGTLLLLDGQFYGCLLGLVKVSLESSTSHSSCLVVPPIIESGVLKSLLLLLNCLLFSLMVSFCFLYFGGSSVMCTYVHICDSFPGGHDNDPLIIIKYSSLSPVTILS
ncbi:hypothetical protein H1C71_035370 [Ictidomys tridecemlineatus]|nr:hypothetical protein H1C71_035370 [Ictidomys tridecemlineatus]